MKKIKTLVFVIIAALIFYGAGQVRADDETPPVVTVGSGETVDTITGSYENYVFENLTESIDGGIIHNEGTIGSIIADFANNYISSDGTIRGGVIASFVDNGTTVIEVIEGNFTNNHVSSTNGFARGAIFVRGGEIGSITGDFTGNSAESTNSYAGGGAIWANSSTIGDIEGNFTDNYAIGNATSASHGGAIGVDVDTTINSIKGNFKGNYVRGTNVGGGAIYNSSSGTIGDIVGNFESNYVSSSSGYARGGAIDNSGTIGDIVGNFEGNYALSSDSYAYGGAIYNYSATIGNIEGDFTSNYASGSSYAYGGAIYNSRATIGNIDGDFTSNYASGSSYAYGGAIYNYSSSAKIGDITGDFTDNYAFSSGSYAYGGAIYNYSATIGNIEGDFTSNYASGSSYAYGGAIYNYGSSAKIGDITGNFEGNYALSSDSYAYGGAIYNYSATIGNIEGDFTGNYAFSESDDALGGAIYNRSGTITISDSTFTNNAVVGTTALGGAIYNTGTINLENVTFAAAGTITIDEAEYEASNDIYNTGTINVSGKNEFNSDISGTNGKITITEDNEKTNFNNSTVTGQIITVNGGEVNVADITFEDGSITNSAVINTSGENTFNTVIMNRGTITTTGENEFNSKVTSNGTINIFGTDTYNDTFTNSGTVNMVNNEINSCYVETLTSRANASYKIDLVFSTSDGTLSTSSDTITAGADSSGIITITEINTMYALTEGGTQSWTQQILHYQGDDNDGNPAIQLALSDDLQLEYIFEDTIIGSDDLVNSTVQYDEKFSEHTQGATTTVEITGLETTDTTNDSIGGTIETEYGDIKYVEGDTLALINQANADQYGEGFDEREFVFTDSTNIYTSIEDAGKTGSGSLSVIGVSDGDNHSTINFSGFNGFTVNEGSTLNISDTTLSNSNDYAINNVSGVVNLTNVTISEGEGDYANSIVNSSTINTSGTNIFNSEITNTGEMNLSGTNTFKADISGENGTITLTNDNTETTFNGSTVTSQVIMVTGGVLNITDSTIEDGSVENSATITASGENTFNTTITNTSEINLSRTNTFNANISGESGKITITEDNEKTNFNNSTVTGQTITVNGGEVNVADITFEDGSITNSAVINMAGENTFNTVIENTGTINVSGENYFNSDITGSGTTYITADNETTTITAGVTDQNIVMNGGTLNLYTDGFEAGSVTANAGTIDMSDGETNSYNMGALTSAEDVNYIIDIDLSGSGAGTDTITAGANSSGTITITDINFTGDMKDFEAQVLYTDSTDIEIALSDDLKSQYATDEYVDSIYDNYNTEAHARWNDEFYTDSYDIYEKTSLDVKASDGSIINDTIIYIIEDYKDNEKSQYIGDTLALVNTASGEGFSERSMSFDTADDVYTSTANAGKTAEGVMSVIGVPDNEGNHSTIDFNGWNGFEVNEGSTLNISDTTLSNSNDYAINNVSGEVNLTDVTISASEGDYANSIVNSSTINTSGTNIFNSKITNTGSMNLSGTNEFNADISGENGTITLTRNNETTNFNEIAVTGQTITVNGGEVNIYSSEFSGGNIYNSGGILNIENTSFTGNSSNTYGGAIYNSGTITSITGYFSGNSAQSIGGAIYNSGTIGDITGDFVSNYVTAAIEMRDGGGAIENRGGVIGDITGDFIGNYVLSDYTSYYYGGAIHLYSAQVGDITGNFIGNYVYCPSGYDASGGALALEGSGSTIGIITGDFIGNYTETSSGYAEGGAINNYSIDSSMPASIEGINGNFLGNYIKAGTDAYGGGAIFNHEFAAIGYINGDFIGNYADAINSYTEGGAIRNQGTIGDIKGNFTDNYASTSGTFAEGGAICNNGGGTIGDITGDFTGNYAVTTGISDNNYAYGGAIYNSGSIGSTTDDTEPYSSTGDDNSAGGIINSSFYNNYAESTSGEAKGGAIYTTKDMNFVSTDGYTMVFSGNYTISSGEEDDNAIYVDSADATVTFSLSNGGAVVMEDNIRGEEGYSVNIVGDDVDNTTFYMLNEMYGANLSAGNTTINTINNDVHTYDQLASFNLTGDINMVVDVDLKNETMDRIATNNNYGDLSGTLTVTNMNLLSDSTEDSVSIYFAETGLMEHVKNGTGELPGSYQTAYTPIYKYIVEYEMREGDGGYFTFTRNGRNTSDSFNPAVLVSSVASQLGAYTALTTTYEYAFEHSNYYMKLPNATRLAMQNGNKYAITENNNTFYQSNEMTDRGMWYRPYTSFESANLKRGPKVDAINYGTLIGGDGEFKEYKNGWGGVFSAYVGYNGSSLSYSGVHTYQNGGLLGVTQTFYKNNFFTALTATAGASVGEASTMYGHENFTMLMAGIASKTGYNLEFKEGRLIVQPSLLLSYSFINTFDYRNAAGVRINSDPLHAIEINPNIRFVMNCRNGWQPYASVGMIWNILDETKVTANNVTLPEMSIRPYVEYGLGIQRLWNDKYGGYLQAMIRNGGRNGVVLTAGFRFKFGKEPKTVKNNDGNAISERKVIKQLTPTNTVSERKVIKQL